LKTQLAIEYKQEEISTVQMIVVKPVVCENIEIESEEITEESEDFSEQEKVFDNCEADL